MMSRLRTQNFTIIGQGVPEIQGVTHTRTNYFSNIDTRGATSLKLSSFELFELFIFELEPSPSLGSILVFELRALDVELRALTRAFAK